MKMKDKYSIEEVFNMIGVENLIPNSVKKEKDNDIIIQGKKIRRKSLRYMTFYQKGCKCVSCGKQGTHFKLDGSNDNPERMHFNLYADDDTLMTKDHIIPRSRGGQDHVDNLQPMCVDCNVRKGNFLQSDTVLIYAQNGSRQMVFPTAEFATVYYIKNKKGKNSAQIIQDSIEVFQFMKSLTEIPMQLGRWKWRAERKIYGVSLQEYGYTWEGMLPLSQEQAMQLYSCDFPVMLLYPDDTEAYAETAADIINHEDGMFGLEKDVIAKWKKLSEIM